MDEELRQHLLAMEDRLMGRINGVLDRLSELRGDPRGLRSDFTPKRPLAAPRTPQPQRTRVRCLECDGASDPDCTVCRGYGWVLRANGAPD